MGTGVAMGGGEWSSTTITVGGKVEGGQSIAKMETIAELLGGEDSAILRSGQDREPVSSGLGPGQSVLHIGRSLREQRREGERVASISGKGELLAGHFDVGRIGSRQKGILPGRGRRRCERLQDSSLEWSRHGSAGSMGSSSRGGGIGEGKSSKLNGQGHEFASVVGVQWIRWIRGVLAGRAAQKLREEFLSQNLLQGLVVLLNVHARSPNRMFISQSDYSETRPAVMRQFESSMTQFSRH